MLSSRKARRNIQTIIITLIPAKVMMQLKIDIIFRHMKDKKVLGVVFTDLCRGSHA